MLLKPTSNPLLTAFLVACVVLLSICPRVLAESAVSGNSISITGKSDKFRVITSIPALSLIARDVLKPYAEVESLLSGMESPHHYSLKVSELRKMSEADLLVWVGPGFEQFMEKAIGRFDNKAIQLASSPNMRWPEGKRQQRDLHLWLSPVNALASGRAIVEFAAQVRPQLADHFAQNLSQFEQQLEREEISWRQELDVSKDFAVYHDGYDHLVSHFGLKQLVAIRPSEHHAAGVRHMQFVRQQLQKGSYCLFVEASYHSKSRQHKAAKRLAEELNLNLASLDPLAATRFYTSYADFMTQLLEDLNACLQDSSSFPRRNDGLK